MERTWMRLKAHLVERKEYWRFWEGAWGWNFACVLVYLVFPKHLFSIADLFAVGYLWVVGNEDKCCVVTHRAADIRVAWLVYARTYGVPIATLHQNKRTRLLYLGDAQIKRKALILHANARISEVGFLRESLGWARIKCLLSALTSVYGRFPVTKNVRKLPWKGPSSEECVPFGTSSIHKALVTNIHDGSTDIPMNSLERPVIPCENS